MKLLLSLILLAGIVVTSFTQSSSTEETALLSLNRRFIQNFLNNDTVEHNKIIHPSNFLFIGTNGTVLNRDEYMRAWAHGYDRTITPRFELEEVQVRMFDNMALVVAKTKDTKRANEGYVTGETRYTDTYVKEKGEWKCVQVQLTRISN